MKLVALELRYISHIVRELFIKLQPLLIFEHPTQKPFGYNPPSMAFGGMTRLKFNEKHSTSYS
jgi:hypothetical protein